MYYTGWSLLWQFDPPAILDCITQEREYFGLYLVVFHDPQQADGWRPLMDSKAGRAWVDQQLALMLFDQRMMGVPIDDDAGILIIPDQQIYIPVEVISKKPELPFIPEVRP